jgi:hypothetical protein
LGVQEAISHVGDLAYMGMSSNEIYKIIKEHNTFSNILSIFALIDPFCIVINKSKRAIHDYIAGSYVVSKANL